MNMPPLSFCIEQCSIECPDNSSHGHGNLVAVTKESGSNRRRCCSNTVSFAPTCQVRKILHVNDFSEDEIQASWFTGREMKRLQERNAAMVQFLDAATTKQSTNKQQQRRKLCTRGLDQLTPQAIRRKARVRRALYEAVKTVDEMAAAAAASAASSSCFDNNELNVNLDDESKDTDHDKDQTDEQDLSLLLATACQHLTGTSIVDAYRRGLEDANAAMYAYLNM